MAVALIVKYSLLKVHGTLSFVFRDCLVDENIIFLQIRNTSFSGSWSQIDPLSSCIMHEPFKHGQLWNGEGIAEMLSSLR